MRAGSTIFEVEREGDERGRCFPNMMSYCCDIPEVEYKSGLKEGTAV